MNAGHHVAWFCGGAFPMNAIPQAVPARRVGRFDAGNAPT